MAKAKEALPADSGEVVAVRYLESPNAIVTEGEAHVTKSHAGDLVDVVVKRPGALGKLTLFNVAPLDPKRMPPVYPTWHVPKPERLERA